VWFVAVERDLILFHYILGFLEAQSRLLAERLDGVDFVVLEDEFCDVWWRASR
jgi:hypothetical protein